MDIVILGSTRDNRTNTPVLYATMPIPDYLELVGEEFHQFFIQRGRQKHKAYKRMKEDIKQGALLPTITLAVPPEKVEAMVPGGRLPETLDGLRDMICRERAAYILDGLQRTFILHDLQEEGHVFLASQRLHAEFWLEPRIENLIYRIIVLNAGQKPMSMRHQVELLFITLRERLQTELNVEILTERDGNRRTQARKYSLDRIAAAYHAFLGQSPEVGKDNIVASSLRDAEILDSTEKELTEAYEEFRDYLDMFAKLDDEVCRIYFPGRDGLPNGVAWFGGENLMCSFFAALSIFGINVARKARISQALGRLLETLKASSVTDDPMGLTQLQILFDKLNPRKTNVGVGQRLLMCTGWREFFREQGEVPLEEHWKTEAESVL